MSAFLLLWALRLHTHYLVAMGGFTRASVVTTSQPLAAQPAAAKPMADPYITPQYDVCKKALPPIKYLAGETVGTKGLVYFFIAMALIALLFVQASKGARSTVIRFISGTLGILLFGGVVLAIAAHSGHVGC